MKDLKKITLQLPEFFLMAAILFYWLSTSTIINPIAIGLLLVLVFQIIFKNRIIGIAIPSLLILVSFYMLLALISEFNEFPTFNANAKELLFVGLTFFTSSIIISGIMIYKYSAMDKPTNEQLSS